MRGGGALPTGLAMAMVNNSLDEIDLAALKVGICQNWPLGPPPHTLTLTSSLCKPGGLNKIRLFISAPQFMEKTVKDNCAKYRVFFFTGRP